ncbi:hypothetical protein ACIHEI_08850 [Kitasatospora sp. NPDC051984]|uniref:hypothetical protein n=1 Tax=Kitasatospora sp. NPDC051984 TaxID=3364059 RepID=UPI0037CA4DD3
MKIRSKIAAGAISIAALGLGLISASPASAYASPGDCSNAGACLFYSPGFSGAYFGDTSGTSKGYEDYPYNSTYTFGGGGSGSGQYVRNNAASVYNYNSSDSVWIYYSPGGYGVSQRFYPKSGGDLISALRNNNASQCFDTYGICR